MREALESFAERAPSPFFVYDLVGLRAHLETLALGPVRTWYACKANPLGAVLDVITETGLGFDCASLGELEHVLARGVGGARILLTGPGKTEAFLRRALEARVETFIVESIGQLALLDRIARDYPFRPRVLLRLQLDWSDAEANLLGGAGISAFGCEPETWASFDFTRLEAVAPVGVHVFQWGNITEIDRLAAIWTRIAHEAEGLARRLGFPLEIVDFGGGLGIAYDGGPDLDWSTALEVLIDLHQGHGWRETWLEPGRYAVGPFGAYLARVVDRKQVRGEALLVLEGGINHLMRPALTGQPFPCRRLVDREGGRRRFRVHGPLCTALDFLGEHLLPEETRAGDWLVFDRCGAYGFTESMPFFLCHDLPGEAVWDGHNIHWIRVPEPAGGWLV